MRIPSGTTDQYIYFVAVDSTDLSTRETGLTTFTVYRSRNGAAATAMTTPTINEVDATNMPGVYELLVDEDTSIASGNTEEEMVFHITQASMAPVTRSITLFRPVVTEGETLTVTTGDVTVGSIDSGAVSASALAADAVTEIANAVGDFQIVDAVSADGTIPTLQQALYEIVQQLQESNLSGTTITVNKQDGTTSLMTLTVNDGTNPTTITRAS